MSMGRGNLVFDRVGRRFYSNGRLVHALRDVSLSIDEGEFVCLVGPSGCGKSTLLNIAAGLFPPSTGEVRYQGNPIPMPNTKVGYITQKDNLLPWRTVRRNIGIALELDGRGKWLGQERVDEMLALVGLGGFEDAYPSELSGGMRKRVTLARTLVYDPKVILADEPFGALDAQLKLILGEELLRIWGSGSGRTFVFVTHDIGEAIALGDRVIVFSRRPGRIKLDCSIPLARPRDIQDIRFDPEYSRLFSKIWTVLSEDIRAGEEVA